MGTDEKIIRFRFDHIILERENLNPKLVRLISEDSWFDIIDDTNQYSHLTLIKADTGEEFLVATHVVERFYRFRGVECSG